MSPPFSDCTFVEQRTVIRHLRSEGVKPTEVHKRILQNVEETAGIPAGGKVKKVAEHLSLMKAVGDIRPLYEH
jgi:hypothetical protein